jgi:signal peptidase I
MGDNRNGSLDSRSAIIGFVDERRILGEAIYSLTPFEKIIPLH